MLPTYKKNRTYYLLTVGILLFGGLFLLTQTALTVKKFYTMDEPTKYERQITIDAVGKASGMTDTATIQFGVQTKGEDISALQEENTQKMNDITDKVKALGIEEKDIQTVNYSLNPEQTYNPNTRVYEDAGWVISQTVKVKVRDLENAPSVLDLAGKNGATFISGPSFNIEDTEALKQQAREDALTKINEKKKFYEEELGLELEEIVSYNEWSNDGNEPMPYARNTMMDEAGGMGGGGSTPNLQSGSNEVTMNVNVTYSLER